MKIPTTRNSVGVLVSSLAFVIAVTTIASAAWRLNMRPRTDDAYLQADLVHMAADVSGRITDATTAEAALATAWADLARAHTQSLVNAVALAFATGSPNANAAAGMGIGAMPAGNGFAASR
jgi:hypothetical protein